MPQERLRTLIAEVTAQRSVPGKGDFFARGDSIDRLEVVLAIEAALGITLDEAKLTTVRNLEDLDRAVEAELAARASSPPAAASPALPSFAPPTSARLPLAPWSGIITPPLCLGLRTWFRIRVTGAHHLPEDRGCLLCANHNSHLDSLALLVAAGRKRPRLVFAAAKDYFFDRPRTAGLLARVLPLIPWERGGNLAVMRENLRHLQACRAANRMVVFYPEGSRSRDGTLQPFKEGLSFFATQSGLPIVPVWIGGTHHSLAKGRRWPRPGQLSVQFGAPISPTNDPTELAKTVRAQMLALGSASS
jgi:long-chain acyl-CoA synthetase